MTPGSLTMTRVGNREASGMPELKTSFQELLRLPSPALKPQALACDGDHLWLGSWETSRIYGIDRRHGTVFEEFNAPGGPVGAVVVGDELRIICSEQDDSRFIRRFVPGHGFKGSAIPCPDDSGSFLAYDGNALWLSQRHNMRVLELDANYHAKRAVPIGAEITGIVWMEEALYLTTWHGKEEGAKIMRWREGKEQPEVLASPPFAAISLTHDGYRFWTNDFKANAMVAFALEE